MKGKFLHLSIMTILVWIGIVATCQGQLAATQEIGLLPYGSYHGGDIDSIDLKSGNLFVKIPLFSLPQLGDLSLSMSMIANNSGFGIGAFCDTVEVASTNGGNEVGYDDTACWPYVYRSTTFGPYLSYDQSLSIIDNFYPLQNQSGGEEYDIVSMKDSTNAQHIMGEDGANTRLYHTTDGSGYTYTGNAIYSPEGISHNVATSAIKDKYGNAINVTSPYAPPPNQLYFFPRGSDSNDPNYSTAPSTPPDGTDILSSYFIGTINDSLQRSIPSFFGATFLTDTASLSACPSVGQINQQPTAIQNWSVPGPNGTSVTYKFCYTNITVNTNYLGGYWSREWQDGNGNNDPLDDVNYYADYIANGDVIQSIILPNGKFWGFVYDSAGPPTFMPGNSPYINTDVTSIAYGDITKIIYPTGGYVSYCFYGSQSCVGPWSSRTSQPLQPSGLGEFLTCGSSIVIPAYGISSGASRYIYTKTVNDGQASRTWQYNTSQATNGTVNVTVIDPPPVPSENQTSTIHTYAETLPGDCSFPEIKTQRLDGSTVLQTTSTEYYSVIAPETAQTNFQSLTNVLPKTVFTQVLGGGTTTVTYQYPSLYQDVEVYYTGNLTRQQATSGPTILFAQPSSVVITGSDGTNRASATKFQWQNSASFYNANVLDAVALTCTSTYSVYGDACALAGAGQGAANEFLYGDSNSSFNLTTVLQSLNQGFIQKGSLTYDSIGRVIGSKDGNGYPTTIGYGTDASTGAPSPFPNKITNALLQRDLFLFDDNTGNLLWHTDINGTTNDDPLHSTNYTYDVMGRVTSVSSPGGGLAKYCYTDIGGSLIGGTFLGAQPLGTSCPATSPPFSFYATVSSSPNPPIASQVNYDGLGRAISSVAANGAEVDTTYDALGRMYTVSNPYLSKADPTYGVTSYTYDGLNRKTVQTNKADGTTLNWCYNGVATVTGQFCLSEQTSVPSIGWIDATDEAGHHTQQVSDALGNMRAVMEQNPNSAALSFLETDYGYDPLGNLSRVSQLGNVAAGDTPRIRMFSFDWMSRLIASYNAETGVICYGVGDGTMANCSPGYDNNGNLLTKTDAKLVQTHYAYDTLNLLTGKTFSNDSAATPSICYQYGTAADGNNFIGRLKNEWTQSAAAGPCPTMLPATGTISRVTANSYDLMGRVLSSSQCVLSNCTAGGAFNIAQTYDAAGNLYTWTDGVHPSTFTASNDSAGQLKTLQSSWVDAIHPNTLFQAQTSTNNSTKCGQTSVSAYAPTGALQSWSLGPNLNIVRGYDSRLRVTCQTATVP